MKRTILIAAIFLGFSVAGFSQTTEGSGGYIYEQYADGTIVIVEGPVGVVVIDKIQVSADQFVYKVKEISTGKDFNSLPTQAQIAISNHAEGFFANGSLPTDEGSTTTIKRGLVLEGDGTAQAGMIGMAQ